MRVLITGSAGFVGSALARAFEARGDDVAGLDILDSPAHDALDFFRTDDTPYDVAIHCAAVIGGREGIDGSPLAVATNLALDAWYFNWLIRTGTPRAVYFSSSAAYPTMWQDDFATARELREDDIHLDRNLIGRPDAVYGWSKLTGERLADYARQAGVDVLVLRPFSGYSEQQGLDYPFPSIIRRAVRREDPLDIWGDGEQVRDWIHIDDVVAGTLAALDAGEQGPLNLGTGIPTSFDQLAAMVVEAVGDGYNPTIRHLLDKPTGVAWRVADPARMHAIHKPTVTIEEGIRRAIAAMRLDSPGVMGPVAEERNPMDPLVAELQEERRAEQRLAALRAAVELEAPATAETPAERAADVLVEAGAFNHWLTGPHPVARLTLTVDNPVDKTTGEPGTHRKENSMQIELPDTQDVTVHVAPTDAAGFTEVDTLTWAAVDSTGAATVGVTLTPSADTLSCLIVSGTPTPGVVVTASDAAGNSVSATVDVLGGPVTALAMTADAPVDKVPAAPVA